MSAWLASLVITGWLETEKRQTDRQAFRLSERVKAIGRDSGSKAHWETKLQEDKERERQTDRQTETKTEGGKEGGEDHPQKQNP